jgi:hypothetical protein
MKGLASEDITKELKAARDECSRLREENGRPRALLGIPEEEPHKTLRRKAYRLKMR